MCVNRFFLTMLRDVDVVRHGIPIRALDQINKKALYTCFKSDTLKMTTKTYN